MSFHPGIYLIGALCSALSFKDVSPLDSKTFPASETISCGVPDCEE